MNRSKADNPDERAETWLTGWLARREYSVTEASRRLLRKGVSPDRVDRVVNKFSSQGLISDKRYAESLVRRRASRGQGPLLVNAELFRQGVDDEVAREAMREYEWLEIGMAAKTKRFGEALPIDGDEFNRQARFLAGRGFPMDVIFSVLGR